MSNMLQTQIEHRLADKKVNDIWMRIESFVIDDASAQRPFSLVLAEEMQWDQEFTRLAISEYKKFMYLSVLFPDGMTPSVDVDTVWHLHLLYTKNYRSFCRDALGCDFLDHEPSKGGSDESSRFENIYLDTLAKYEEVFGVKAPTEIWGNRT